MHKNVVTAPDARDDEATAFERTDSIAAAGSCGSRHVDFDRNFANLRELIGRDGFSRCDPLLHREFNRLARIGEGVGFGVTLGADFRQRRDVHDEPAVWVGFEDDGVGAFRLHGKISDMSGAA